ncbi:heme ABC transporter ATP-binding protein [Corynebacterium sp. 335C]
MRLSYANRTILDGVDVAVRAGEVTALLGPNGAGKSTLFGVLSGDITPDAGEVLLGGRDIGSFRPRELALRRAVLPQDHVVRFSYSVEEIVRLARLSHRPDREADDRIVAASLDAVEMGHMAARDVQTLSGGEMGRAAFARVLAQTAPVVLLDEPTAALDLRHQEAVLRAARTLRDAGTCVVVVLHDLNLAAAYADRILLLEDGRIAADGAPADVLTAPTIRRLYHQPVTVVEHPTRGCPLVITVDDPEAGEGPDVPAAPAGG